MPNTLDDTKSELIAKATEVAAHGRGSGGPPIEQIGGLLRAYYRHVPPEDVCTREPVDAYGAFAAHYRLAQERPQGTTSVRVFTPTVAEHGWSAGGHTVVEVITDDMPFLVDSATMELARQGHHPLLVIHPQFEVTRDITGALRTVAVADERIADTREAEATRESWMHIEIDADTDAEDVAAIEEGLREVLRDVREAVEDWQRMHARILEIVEQLEQSPPPLPASEIKQGAEFLTWLADDHFTFLGCRDYRLEAATEGVAAADADANDLVLRAVPGSGLGVLRSDPDLSEAFSRLPEIVRSKAREKTLLVLAKANSRATVHRATYLDYVGVKVFDEAGEVVGERRFLGLFSSAAYTESLTRIPLLREKAAEVMARIGFDPTSHAGKALMDTLENYPRDELFHTPVEELADIAEAVMFTQERRQLRLFVRGDTYGRYLSCLVYLPRDRYNTTVRQRIATILGQRFGGEVEFTARVTESNMARLHFVVRPPQGRRIDGVDVGELERRLVEATRSWQDDFAAAVRAEFGEQRGAALAREYGGSFPEAYKEDYAARTGAVDLGRLEAIGGEEGLDLALTEDLDAAGGEARLKVYRVGSPLSLSHVLPMLSSMGVEVVDERPFELEGLARRTLIYDFGLRYSQRLPATAHQPFQDAVRAIWNGQNEVDGFNRLVLAAGLTWRQAALLRAYAKYLRQGGSPFAQDYIEEALAANLDITRGLVALFEARLAPGAPADDEGRIADVERIEASLSRALDDVASLDHDRILRSYRTVISATLRTNYFQRVADGGPDAAREGADPDAAKSYIALKLDPGAIPDLPEPRPRYEIFVYSPRVEGVHLRFGSVARGGLRWSDRRDDFRTEVLGLVKAQMVKNTVIVPVGAKGGFFAKLLPDPGDRDAWLAEGVAAYTTFISGLLDVTDNLVDGATVPPPRVVRHDGDDSYLVVAADKGTATFSDIANRIAGEYGFWLGDAFASGGSVGYDHKGMGITARGAWVSVQRHFREMGVDCQREEFTCVGIGDMSGDVFGNGMLCSPTTRLVAAFDHRDIFLDPQPDAAVSHAERKRLFELPRSSWKDYDRSLISAGGGVFPRSAKSIPLTPEICERLDIDAATTSLTPAELIRAILTAPVDLLWNGGIGTYVKGSAESNAEVGDKANDGIRIDGADLRVRCVGEGGNLGFTQRGRIEYAAAGGRINTDFIDNSAGVDTSDHEVNLKILLDRVVAAGDLTGKQRNELLAAMTDEVAQLVLRDNYEQNLALANAVAGASVLVPVHEEQMKHLEQLGVLNRDLEALPDSRRVRRRMERGEGLHAPELAVLMSWTKIVLAEELLESQLPDDPWLRRHLLAYFPAQIRDGFAAQATDHPLHREIIVTQAVNDLVNGAGITFWTRLSAETGASAEELTRTNFMAREIFAFGDLSAEFSSWDNKIPAAAQTQMRLELRNLIERSTRWLVTNLRHPLEIESTVQRFGEVCRGVLAELPEILTGREAADAARRRDLLTGQGVPEDLATRVSVLASAHALLGVAETAEREGLSPSAVAKVHVELGERLGLSVLAARVLGLKRSDRWQTMARAALRDDLDDVHRRLTAQVLQGAEPGSGIKERIEAWVGDNAVAIKRAVAALDDITSDEEADLARVSVGLRVVRGLLVS
ncbi:NAD-glutamate dehydrogenase [Nocardioides dubius]|uniref:NAD-glutamate dehydrogenase n=1 Tax=Nocardioides dubius TaxID=317019 RepID=A0ABN1TMJ4_9ACTN